MVFSSVLFLFRFLPIFMICYFLVPRNMKNLVLFLGSLVFYAWGEPVYIFLMLFSTISDFVWGRLIEEYRGEDRSRIFLLCSVVINLFILGFFKYADFLLQTVNTVFGTSIPLLGLPLPIGISFYTFQTMSYVIDVYRGDTKAQRNILQFGVYVTMFPQLIAGPILKYHQIEKYLQERRSDLDAISYGAKRFVTGLAKKVLLANNLGLLWTQISSLKNDQMSVLMAWIGIVAYAFQIYFDFSGYSDMAIGLGAILGFHFPENFNYPYIATSVTDFWHRWHISLSTWFKEYVYIPLGGNRKGLPRQILNILVVWNLAWRRVEFPVLGTLVCLVFNSGKTVFGRAPEKCSGGVWQSLYADSGIDQLGIFRTGEAGRDSGISAGDVWIKWCWTYEHTGNVFGK